MGRKRNGKPVDMLKIREVLRLKAGGFNQSEIARACRIARSTVQDYLRRAEACGLTHEAAEPLSDSELGDRLGRNKRREQRKALTIDFSKVHEELTRKGVTLELLWREQVLEAGSDVSYSTFCRRYQAWCYHKHLSMRQTYRPGEKGFVDYAGLKIPYVDRTSGEIFEASVFVAALGASNYTYAEATADQSLPCWIGSHCRALNFFGGAPAALVPDNLKTGVKEAWWYEPDINRTYRDFAEHHGIAILPTRIQKPRDKAKVEKAVQDVERWVIAPLRHRTFYSVAEINEAIRPLLAALNARMMRDYQASRSDLFDRLEKPALKPLPALPYQFAQWKKARVNIDYHVEFERHWYSVPYYHVRKEVWIKATEKLIEVYLDNQRVAFHERSRIPGRFTTLPEHMPPTHAEVRSWTAERFVSWSQSIGAETHKFVQTLFAVKAHPEQAFRAILGLQRMCDKYSPARLEAACRRANHFKLGSARSIKSILEHGWDKLSLETSASAPALLHGNLRGAVDFH